MRHMSGEASNREVGCVVLGAGVLGLSIASVLVERGIVPVIVARELPEDMDSTGHASPWAGAEWSSSASDPVQRRWDAISFQRYARMSKEWPELVKRRPFKIYSLQDELPTPWYETLVYNYRPLPLDEIPKPYKSGITFESYTLHAPKYCAHLGRELRDKGVVFVRRRISALDEAFTVMPNVTLVITATGLGSRTLLGLEDPKVYPGRGQTVLVESNVETCYSEELEWKAGEEGSLRRYVIPRPGGTVILGGTFDTNNYSTLPCPATAERIMRDACDLCPELGDYKDLKVISHQAGLRPMRSGGVRLEIEKRVIGQQDWNLLPEVAKRLKGKLVSVVHAYGAGAGGYQSSWGMAEAVADLVETPVGADVVEGGARV